MNFAGYAEGEPLMGIPVVGRCRPSDCDILSNHQHLQDGINYLCTPVHVYSNRKDNENKSFAVNFTISNVFKWLVEYYSFIGTLQLWCVLADREIARVKHAEDLQWPIWNMFVTTKHAVCDYLTSIFNMLVELLTSSLAVERLKALTFA